MMKATLCDRCGRIIQGAVPTFVVTATPRIPDLPEACDLCSVCSEDFDRWIRGNATENAVIGKHFATLRGES
jgi:hypothetical protein